MCIEYITLFCFQLWATSAWISQLPVTWNTLWPWGEGFPSKIVAFFPSIWRFLITDLILDPSVAVLKRIQGNVQWDLLGNILKCKSIFSQMFAICIVQLSEGHRENVSGMFGGTRITVVSILGQNICWCPSITLTKQSPVCCFCLNKLL